MTTAPVPRHFYKSPILYTKDMEDMGGHFIQGKVTAYTGQIINMCIYTSPNYNILKQDKYKDALASVDLWRLLKILPLGVDLQACADYLVSFIQDSQVGTFKGPMGQDIEVQLSPLLVAAALLMDHTALRVYPIKLEDIKMRNFVKLVAKKNFKYNEFLDKKNGKYSPGI